MNISDIQDVLNADGWDGLGKEMSDHLKIVARTASLEEDNERKRQAQIFADAFGTPAGQQALELLELRTFRRPPTQAELDERDPHAMAIAAARRMGAANLVHQILSAIDYARGLKPKETNDAS